MCVLLTLGVPGGLALTTSIASDSFFSLEGDSGEMLGVMRDSAASDPNTEHIGSDLTVASIGRG